MENKTEAFVLDRANRDFITQEAKEKYEGKRSMALRFLLRELRGLRAMGAVKVEKLPGPEGCQEVPVVYVAE